jgi:hypothetical protein
MKKRNTLRATPDAFRYQVLKPSAMQRGNTVRFRHSADPIAGAERFKVTDISVAGRLKARDGRCRFTSVTFASATGKSKQVILQYDRAYNSWHTIRGLGNEAGCLYPVRGDVTAAERAYVRDYAALLSAAIA